MGEPDHQARGGLLYFAIVKSPAQADYMHMLQRESFTKPPLYLLRNEAFNDGLGSPTIVEFRFYRLKYRNAQLILGVHTI